VRQGIAVPFRKSEPEQLRTLAALQAADRGGMMFQPVPGTYEDVGEIDFTSLYPSIIAHENLSPETLGHPGRPGFLPAALRPVLDLRIRTKRQKKTDPRLAGPDAILKWMLVTCFGYTVTGTRSSEGLRCMRQLLPRRGRSWSAQRRSRRIWDTASSTDRDSLWVQGAPVGALKERVERELGYALETEHFDWIVFLPLADGFGAYNRYYGPASDGSIRVRGIAARRHDTPLYVRGRCSVGCSDDEAGRGPLRNCETTKSGIGEIYRDAVVGLAAASPEQMTICRQLGRTAYRHRCLEGAAVQAYREQGTEVAAGMRIRYVVEDARRYRAVPVRDATTFDVAFYRMLLERARDEILAAYPSEAPAGRAPARPWDGPGKRAVQKNATLS